jgi:hypothetical protein
LLLQVGQRVTSALAHFLVSKDVTIPTYISRLIPAMVYNRRGNCSAQNPATHAERHPDFPEPRRLSVSSSSSLYPRETSVFSRRRVKAARRVDDLDQQGRNPRAPCIAASPGQPQHVPCTAAVRRASALIRHPPTAQHSTASGRTRWYCTYNIPSTHMSLATYTRSSATPPTLSCT